MMRKRLRLVIGISFAFIMTSCEMSTQSVQEDSIFKAIRRKIPNEWNTCI